MEAKDNRNQDAYQIKSLATSKADPPNSDIDASENVPRKMKARTGVLLSRKQQGKKKPKYKGSQRYCVMCKKDGINE